MRMKGASSGEAQSYTNKNGVGTSVDEEKHKMRSTLNTLIYNNKNDTVHNIWPYYPEKICLSAI